MKAFYPTAILTICLLYTLVYINEHPQLNPSPWLLFGLTVSMFICLIGSLVIIALNSFKTRSF